MTIPGATQSPEGGSGRSAFRGDRAPATLTAALAASTSVGAMSERAADVELVDVTKRVVGLVYRRQARQASETAAEPLALGIAEDA